MSGSGIDDPHPTRLGQHRVFKKRLLTPNRQRLWSKSNHQKNPFFARPF